MGVIHVTGADYEKEVLQSDKPVLIDFWASWCGPCQMLGPVIEEVSNEVDDVKFVKINTEEAPEIAEKFSIMYIPTLVLLENGEVKDKATGFLQKEQVLEFIGKKKF